MHLTKAGSWWSLAMTCIQWVAIRYGSRWIRRVTDAFSEADLASGTVSGSVPPMVGCGVPYLPDIFTLLQVDIVSLQIRTPLISLPERPQALVA